MKYLFVIIGALLFVKVNAEIIAEDRFWSLTDDSILTIKRLDLGLLPSSVASFTKQLVIGDSITSIPDNTFLHFENLEKIIIGKSVKMIGSNLYHPKLKSVEVNDAELIIGKYAFYGCPNLKNVDLGENVTEIQTEAFSGCDKLESINFGHKLESIGDAAFFWCKQLTNLTFPQSVKSIGQGAFMSCSMVKSIVLPDSLLTLGAQAFAGSGAESVSFPSTLKRIENGAFGDSHIANVQFKEGLEYIGKNAFERTQSLRSIQFPTSLRTIDDGAFNNCYYLEVPDMSGLINLDSIGHFAFENPGAFRFFGFLEPSLIAKLPSNISYISPTAFYHEHSIIEFQIEDNGRYYTQDGILYDKNGILMKCPTSQQKSNIDIPEGIQVISSGAFFGTDRNNTGLRNIRIPSSVKVLGAEAFSDSFVETINIPFGIDYFQPQLFRFCKRLTNIMIESPEPPKIGLDAFASVPRDTLVVNIPKGCKDIYQQAPGWDQFENIEEIDMCPVGDINEDGRINVIDINMLSNYILSGSADNKYYSDVNRDDHIDILDIRGVSNFVTSNSFTSQEHNCVDLGLPSGTLWAETNIGAKRPSDFGDYFAWGETEPKETYTWGNYKWNRNDSLSIETEVMYEELNGETLSLTRDNDPATKKWGNDWQVPTQEMIQELKDNCTLQLTCRDGVMGTNVVGKNNNSIFLPHAGYKNEISLQWLNKEGTYMFRNVKRQTLHLLYVEVWQMDNDNAFGINCGYSVRPVKKPVKRNMQKSLHRSISDVYAEPIEITEGEEKSFSISLNSVKDITGLQFDLVLPVGLSLVGVKQNVGESTHLLKYQKQKDGSIRILEYSVANDVIEQSENGILEITVKADEGLQSDAKIQFNDIIMATTGNDCIKTSFETDVRVGSMTSIQHAIESKQDAAVYNVSGTQIKSMKASDLMKGSYIINGKKTIVK